MFLQVGAMPTGGRGTRIVANYGLDGATGISASLLHPSTTHASACLRALLFRDCFALCASFQVYLAIFDSPFAFL